MANVVETTGRVARTVAGADGVEIKATIPEKQVDPALHAYGLSLSDSERYIYFFDTPELELLETGVIARASALSVPSTTARSSFARSFRSRSRRSGESTAVSRSRLIGPRRG